MAWPLGRSAHAMLPLRTASTAGRYLPLTKFLRDVKEALMGPLRSLLARASSAAASAAGPPAGQGRHIGLALPSPA